MKRAITLLLALAAVLSMTACGAKKPDASSGAAPEGERIKLTMGVNGYSNVTEFQNNALVRWLEEVTGYDIEVQVYANNATERNTQIATQVASGEPLPDVMYYFAMSVDNQNMYGRDGYLYDVSEFLDDKEFMAKLAKKYDFDRDACIAKNCEPDVQRRYRTETRNSDGQQWALPSLGGAYTDMPKNMLYINQKWLDKLGLEMPRTLDELEHVLTEFVTKDPNGNGKPDEMGMVGTVNIARGDIPSWIINNFIFLNDAYMFNCDDDGKIYLPYDRDEYREGLKAVRNLYDKGLIPEMTWTMKEAQELPPLFTPVDEVAKIGVWAGHPTLRVIKDNPVLYEYVGLPPMEGSNAAYEPLTVNCVSYVGGESKHPAEAFEVLYALGTPEGARRQRYGEPGVDWEWRDCDPQCPYCHGKGQRGDGKAMKVLNYDAFSGQTSTTFGIMGISTSWTKDPDIPEHANRDVTPAHSVWEPDDGIETWSEYRNRMHLAYARAYMKAAEENNPKNVTFKFVYTLEEQDAISQAKTDILTYAQEMRAKFCTGEIDVNDDAVWKNYVDTIHGLGWDVAIEKTQAAYDRMQAQM